VADEEVTDLTEEGSESKAEPAKEKPAKAAKAAGDAEDVTDKGAKDKGKGKGKGKSKGSKKGGGGGVIAIMLIIALLLAGSFGAAVYFDVFSARAITSDLLKDPLLRVVIWLDPTFSTVDERMRNEAEARDRRLTALEERLEERTQDLAQRESRADTREQQLDRRAIELNNREEQIIAMYERTVPLYRRDMTLQEREDMEAYSRTFTQMAPDAAAQILVGLGSVDNVAAILYFMSERNAAAIMAAFHPDYAAAVTNVWLYN